MRYREIEHEAKLIRLIEKAEEIRSVAFRSLVFPLIKVPFHPC